MTKNNLTIEKKGSLNLIKVLKFEDLKTKGFKKHLIMEHKIYSIDEGGNNYFTCCKFFEK